MSGIIAVYGLVVAVLIANAMNPPPDQNTSLYTYVSEFITSIWMVYFGSNYAHYRSFMHLASGLSVGLAGIAAGYTIGVVGDAVSRVFNFRTVG